MHPRPHGRVEKIFAPYTETSTLACPVLPEGLGVPGSGTRHQEDDQDPGSRHRWVAAQGDLAIPPAVQAARAVLGNGLALNKRGCHEPGLQARPAPLCGRRSR